MYVNNVLGEGEEGVVCVIDYNVVPSCGVESLPCTCLSKGLMTLCVGHGVVVM